MVIEKKKSNIFYIIFHLFFLYKHIAPLGQDLTNSHKRALKYSYWFTESSL